MWLYRVGFTWNEPWDERDWTLLERRDCKAEKFPAGPESKLSYWGTGLRAGSSIEGNPWKTNSKTMGTWILEMQGSISSAERKFTLIALSFAHVIWIYLTMINYMQRHFTHRLDKCPLGLKLAAFYIIFVSSIISIT